MPIIDSKKLPKQVKAKYTIVNNSFRQVAKPDSRDLITVEVGDVKQPDFYPQVKINRWGTSEETNEVNFSIRLKDDDYSESLVETEGEIIKWIKGNKEVHLYDKPDASEDGGYELEVVFNEKPASNVVEFTIQTKELDFFYQPALTQEEIDEGADRPENVVGSYAVYHKTKGGMNRADGMDYKTGKAFHIYRPKVTDKDGYFTWAELNIDEENGLLSVTVPQEFLDNAVYPVIVDPTFGYTSAGGSSVNISENTIRIVDSHTAPQNGTITQVNAYLDDTTGGISQEIRPVVYLDSNNSRVTFGAEEAFNGSTTPTLHNNNVSNVAITGGVNYSLGYWLNSPGSTAVGFSYDSDASYTLRRDNETYNETNDPPTTFTVDDSNANYKLSIYATYTAPKIETLTDNFNDNSINATIWNDDNASETGGQMVVTANTSTGTYNGIASDSRYDLTASSAFIELVNAGDTSLSFTTYILELHNDTVDLYWGIEYGATDEIVAYKSPDSVNYTEIYRATYDSGIHKWFRIREASGTVYWDTSADGWNWTNRASDATGYDLTALNVFFGVENPASGSTTVTFDNFNVPQGISVSDSSSITESVTVSIQSGLSTPSPSVSDSSTITESLSVDVSDPQITVSDSATITESASVSIESLVSDLSISVSDSSTVTESVTADVSDPQVSVSDSASITEAVTVDVSDPQVSVSDSSTITESTTVSIIDASALAIGVSDPSTITESVVVDVSDPQIAVSEGATITESVGVLVSTLDTPQPVVSDTITIAENVGVVVSDPQVVASESATITESVGVSVEAIVDRSIAVSDTTTISENVITALSDLQIVASESVSVAESASMLIGYRYKKNDRLNLDIGSGLSIPLGKPLSPSWGSNTRPSSPKIDEYGYNKQTGEWEIYTEEGWKTFQDITISASEPENPKENDLWIDIS